LSCDLSNLYHVCYCQTILGNAQAGLKLGIIYVEGDGVEQDYIKGTDSGFVKIFLIVKHFRQIFG